MKLFFESMALNPRYYIAVAMLVMAYKIYPNDRHKKVLGGMLRRFLEMRGVAARREIEALDKKKERIKNDKTLDSMESQFEEEG